MTWSDFYLICFLVGFLLSLVSFLLGSFHLPAVHIHHGPLHIGHVHTLGAGDATGHVGHVGHVDAQSGISEVAEQVTAAARGVHFPFLNLGTITAFLAWFGGTGYLLTNYSSFWFGAAIVISTGVGVAGAMVIFWFVGKVLMKHEHYLDPADYDMIGVLARIASPIRAGGTGEIIYSQEGVRQTAGARSEDGRAIEKGTEVVVTRYEHGIAYVRRWEEMANPEPASEGPEAK